MLYKFYNIFFFNHHFVSPSNKRVKIIDRTYHHHFLLHNFFILKLLQEVDSNHRPRDYETRKLPTAPSCNIWWLRFTSRPHNKPYKIRQQLTIWTTSFGWQVAHSGNAPLFPPWKGGVLTCRPMRHKSRVFKPRSGLVLLLVRPDYNLLYVTIVGYVLTPSNQGNTH